MHTYIQEKKKEKQKDNYWHLTIEIDTFLLL